MNEIENKRKELENLGKSLGIGIIIRNTKIASWQKVVAITDILVREKNRERKLAQKEFLDFLIKFKEEELPMFETKDIGDGYMEDFNLDYPLLDKKIIELKEAVEK